MKGDKKITRSWTIKEGPVGCIDIINGSYLIARILGPRESQDMTNARLIAAAPEMLEALKEIASNPIGSAGAIARKAIIKSEGADV